MHCTMGVIGAIAKAVVFVVAGLVAIVVGAFMLRGNLHMWDRRGDASDREK